MDLGALLLGIAGPFVAGLVGSEVSSGTLREKNHGRGFAIFALAFLLLYNCGPRRAACARRGHAWTRACMGIHPAARRGHAYPANPWRWRGLVETSDFYQVEDLNLAGEFDPARGMVFTKPEPSAALEAARRTDNHPGIPAVLTVSACGDHTGCGAAAGRPAGRSAPICVSAPRWAGILAGAVLDSKARGGQDVLPRSARR